MTRSRIAASGVISATAALSFLVTPLTQAAGQTRPAAAPSNCGTYPCFNTAADVLASVPRPGPGQAASVPLARRAVSAAAGTPLLVAGLDNGPRAYWQVSDGFAQGRSGYVASVSTGNVYNFDHWQYVDELYYYDHDMFSVPPTQWINAAHRNGVPVFGTVTGDCGPKCGSGTQLQTLFDAANYRAAVEKMRQYAVAYGFDGWVIDFENNFAPAPDVLQAVKDLVNTKLPDGRPMRVVVYQAGEYSLLPPSEELSPPSLLPYFRAGTGTPAYYTSTGLFAPEWTYFGNLPDPKTGQVATGPASRALAHAADDALWVGSGVTYAGPGCTRTGTSNNVSSLIAPRSAVGSLPFITSFNEGEGDVYAIAGKLAAATPWNSLSAQDVLPTWYCRVSGDLAAAPVYASAANGDAFNGGSALALTGQNAGEVALYQTRIDVPAGSNPMLAFESMTASGGRPYIRVSFSDGTSDTVQSTGTGAGWQETIGRIGARGKTIVRIAVGFPNGSGSISSVLGELRLYDAATDIRPAAIEITATGPTISWTQPADPRIAYWNVYSRDGSCLRFLGPAFTTSYDVSQRMFGTVQPGTQFVVQPVSASGSAATVGTLCGEG